MKVKELIEYLQKFKEDAELHCIIANIGKRIKYELEQFIVLTDAPEPCMCFGIGGVLTLMRKNV